MIQHAKEGPRSFGVFEDTEICETYIFKKFINNVALKARKLGEWELNLMILLQWQLIYNFLW